MKKARRIQLFLDGLAAAAPCESAAQAFALLEETLNVVEDEHSGVPFNPATWQSDGRLYMPQDDNAIQAKGYRDVTKYRSLGHATLIAANGAFTIQEIATGKVVLEKAGADGRTIVAFKANRNDV